MPSESHSLSIGDFVSVERHDKPDHPLKGVIAFLGPVSFAEGNDWVGVRLTGDSIGDGRNDGSVKGTRYFEDCGKNGGVFVRKGSISKRQPTRLEELRLRRERKSSKSGSTSGTVSPVKKGITSPRASKSETMDTNPLSSPRSESAGVSRVKKQMEKIRKTRESLSSSSSVTPLSMEKTKEIVALREQNNSLTKQNEDLQSEKDSLQSEKDTLEAQKDSLEAQKDSLEEEINKLRTELETPNTEEMNVTPIERDTEMENKLSQLNQEIENLRTQLSSTSSQLTQTQNELTTVQTESLSQQSQISTLETQLQQTKTQLSTTEHELNTINHQNSTHQSSAQEQLKERAKLHAENSSLKRKLGELEQEKLDVETMMEELTLDLEQVKEEKEALEDSLEEKKLDVETAAMDMEELKIQMEELGVQLDQARQQLDHEQQQNQNATSMSTSINLEGEETENSNDASRPTPSSSKGHSADTDDVLQALSYQNARLREALLRLREQSTFEKMELSKKLRTAEKESSQNAEFSLKIQKLQEELAVKEKEINECKEIIDENHAYEGLMEEMSDKNILLEDANVALQATIQSLEEAAEITAEMEEVQAEENKALMNDLEEKDSVIRNLQEAIKMQRRREEDFQRTVLKYKTSIEKLQAEKAALLALNEGGENENTHLIASAQKALAQAAQLVSDAAQMRKKKSLTMFDQMDKILNAQLADRLKSYIPKNVIQEEILAVKGEILLTKVAEKASLSLRGVASLFQKSITKTRSDLGSDLIKINRIRTEEEEKAMDMPIKISESSQQEIPNLIHELNFAHISTNVGAEALRFICLGQWPDLITPEVSGEVAAAILSPFSVVDNAITYQLRMMIEEGTLSPHRSNLTSLEESMKDIRGTLSSISPLANDWTPPAWSLFQDVTCAKFSSLSAAAIMACIISPTAEADTSFVPNFDSDSKAVELFNKLESLATESIKICQRLKDLSIQEENKSLLNEIEVVAKKWMKSSNQMLDVFKSTFNGATEVEIEKLSACDHEVYLTLQDAAALSTLLRQHKMNGEEIGTNGILVSHPLSPESESSWTSLIKMITKDCNFSFDGTEDELIEEMNFHKRSQAIEQRLSLALENESKLALALVQVSSLEKSLISRSKEINMQNARMRELEILLSQSPYQTPRSSPQKSVLSDLKDTQDTASNEEFDAVKKENAMLMEAMDVLNKQVQEYEDEVRSLKNSSKFRTPTKNNMKLHDIADSGSSQLLNSLMTSSGLSQTKVISLEAAIFRPALQAAYEEKNAWKSKLVQSSLNRLSPLNVPKSKSCIINGTAIAQIAQPQDGEDSSLGIDEMNPNSNDEPITEVVSRHLNELTEANNSARLAKASIKMIDLRLESNTMKQYRNVSRMALREQRLKDTISLDRLNQVSGKARDFLTKVVDIKSNTPLDVPRDTPVVGGKNLIGKVIIPGRRDENNANNQNRIIPVAVNKSELTKLHSIFVQ